MSQTVKNPPVSTRDLLTGGVMFVVGLFATYEALGFDAESRLFPAVTAGLLATTGFMVGLLAVLKPVTQVPRPHGIMTPLLSSLAIAAWAIAIERGVGFIIPTFLMQLALFRLAGIRNGKVLFPTAALVAALAYLLFVVLLEIPLPESIMPAPLQGL